MVVVSSGRRFLLSTATAKPRSSGGAQQPQSGPVKGEFIVLIFVLFIGGGDNNKATGVGWVCWGAPGGGAHRPPF